MSAALATEATLVVEVDVELVSLNRLTHEHWRSRHHRRRREREVVRKALSGQRPPPGPWEVTITRLGPRRLDDDAIPTAAKAIRDEIGSFLGCGDGPRAPVVWRYAQEVRREPARGRRTASGWVRPTTRWRVWCRVEIGSRDSASADKRRHDENHGERERREDGPVFAKELV